jgi:hypothetical protein
MGFIKKLLLRLAAGSAVKSLGLVEGTPMENKKPWYVSKTVWSGILTVLIGAYDLIGANLAPTFGWTLPQVPAWIFTVLGALGIYGRVSAEKKIG